MSTRKQTAKVDKNTVNTEAEGAIDLGDAAWVSPVMQDVLAGEPVTFDMSVGELAHPDPDTTAEVE